MGTKIVQVADSKEAWELWLAGLLVNEEGTPYGLRVRHLGWTYEDFCKYSMPDAYVIVEE